MVGLFKIFRLNDWWSYIIPPITSVIYLLFFLNNIGILLGLYFLFFYLITIIGTAIFGFFINDWADINSDLISGKYNNASILKLPVKIIIAVASLWLAIFPWLFLPYTSLGIIFFILQLVLLYIYSIPPLRLKTNTVAAVVCDSLYSGLIFILAIIFSNPDGFEKISFRYLVLIFFILAYFSRGLRNILLHQIKDEKNDKIAGINTYVIKTGIKKSIGLVLKMLLPIEIIFSFILIIILSFSVLYFWIIIPCFLIYFLLKKYDLKSELSVDFYYMSVINDLYEDLLPLTILIYLCFNDVYYIILCVIHVIVFRNKFIWLLSEKIIYGLFYRKFVLWIFYKAFCNKYAKNIYKFLGFKV